VAWTARWTWAPEPGPPPTVTDPSPRRRWLRHPGTLLGGAAVVAAPVLAVSGALAPVAAVVVAVLGLVGGFGVATIGTRRTRAADAEAAAAPAGEADLAGQLDRIDALVAGKVPAAVEARVQRITATLRDTLPRLDQLGLGSAMARDAVQTATTYLPEALGAYLRLPRSFADNRAVSGGKTPLLVLCDQLDILAAEMDQVFVAVCRSDADALVAHGRFLAEKFGAGSTLDIGEAGPTAQRPSTGPA
jgi:hypothetical protein